MMRQRLDLSNQKFNRLTAIKDVGKNSRGERLWLFKCDCGTEVVTIAYKVRNGYKKSCGCLHKEVTSKRASKHNKYGTTIYKKWKKMKERCDNSKSKDYVNYGGRGITYCPEWKEFQPFYDWAMKNGYRDELTLDRIDVNGNYSPSNCRWVDNKTQSNNKRTNVNVTINDETKTLAEWSDVTGIKHSTLYWRYRNGVKGKALIDKKDRRGKRSLV